MRALLVLLAGFTSAFSMAPIPGAAGAPAQVVAASVWPGNSYFIGSNPIVKAHPAFIIDSEARFDAIFHYAATIGSARPLDAAIFARKTLLGIAEEQRALCTSTLDSVTKTGAKYTVRYTQSCPPPSSARYVIPFTVWVPKAPIASVTFIRNGSVHARAMK